MMKSFALSAILLASLVLGVVIAKDDESEHYSDKYDHLDVDAVLQNERLRTQYYKCFLDTGPCITPDAIFFKARFPEAVVTKCRKCTERQKEGFDKIANWFNENDQEGWNQIIAKGVADFQKKAARAKAQKAEQNT